MARRSAFPGSMRRHVLVQRLIPTHPATVTTPVTGVPHWWAACLVLLLSFPLGGQSRDPEESVRAGARLTAAEAEALEERLRDIPDDEAARLELIGYHSGRRYSDQESAQRSSELVLWMIEHDPHHPLLATPYGVLQPHHSPLMFDRAKERWLEHLEQEPDDVVLLGNAAAMIGNPAAFAQDSANRDLALSLLGRAQEIAPTSAEWPFKIGHIIWLGAARGSSDVSPVFAAQALSHFARAYRLGGTTYGPLALKSAMEAAFAAGELADARAYAEDALSAHLLTRRHVEHWANLVLGRIALVDGDPATAGEYLLAAGRVAATPAMSTFGPNMRLAQELLQHGERDVVLEYFELCARFWKRDRLDEWASAVREGRVPDFDANLWY